LSLGFNSNILIAEQDSLAISSNMLQSEAFLLKNEGEYDSAIIIYTKLLDFNYEIGQYDQAIWNLLQLSDLYKKKRDIKSSILSIDSALAVYKNNYNQKKPTYARILQYAGSVFITSGEYDTAYSLTRESIRILEQEDAVNDTILSKSFLNLGNYFWYINNLDSALHNYKLALNKSNTMKDTITNEIRASALQNIGLIYINKGDFEEAEKYLLRSLKLKENIYSNKSISLGRTYFNIASFYSSISQIDTSLVYLNRAEKIYNQHFNTDHVELAKIYWNRSIILTISGDYENALYFSKNALSIYQRNGEKYYRYSQSILMNIGFIYEQIGESELAIEYYKKCLNNELTPTTIRTLRNLANIFSTINKKDEAEKYFLETIEKSKLLYGQENAEIGLAYQYFGNFLIESNQCREGVKYLNKSLDIFNQTFGKKNRYSARVLNFLGDYYRNQSEFIRALDYYQESLISIVQDFNDTNNFSNPDVVSLEADLILLQTLIKKGKTCYSLYTIDNKRFNILKSCDEIYKLALWLINELNDSYTTSEESKIALSNSARTAYIDIINVSYHLFLSTGDSTYLNSMFIYSEESKSSVLSFALQDAEAKIEGNIPKELRIKEKQLKSNLGVYKQKLFEESQSNNPDQDKIALWNSKVFEIKSDLDRLIEFLDSEYKDYYNAKYANETIHPDVIRTRIKKDQTLIEYSLTDSNLYIFLIDKEKYNVYQLEIEDSLLINEVIFLRKVLSDITSKNFDDSDYYLFTKTSHKLYTILIEPIVNDIKGRRVIIIPDAEMNYLSFDLLIDSITDSIYNYRELPYLLNDFIFSYSSSATILFNVISNKRGHKKPRLLAYAPTYENIQNILDNERESLRGALYPLPYVDEEVSEISEMLSGDNYIGFSATESSFKNIASHYDIVHLAMHTIINDESPMFSKLVFTLDQDSIEDGFLNTYELYNLELNGSLVVLSACNTGFGKLEKGEGVMSLARAFMYSGIPSIIMTLWKIEDQPGYKLMTSFYEELELGKPLDVALNEAKKSYLQNSSKINSHPYFWSGYVALGDTSPVIEDFDKIRLLILIGIAILTLIVGYFLYRMFIKSSMVT
jgi:CHAT domain-containing protein/tetratricopeptide (TPR) repeat protein